MISSICHNAIFHHVFHVQKNNPHVQEKTSLEPDLQMKPQPGLQSLSVKMQLSVHPHHLFEISCEVVTSSMFSGVLYFTVPLAVLNRSMSFKFFIFEMKAVLWSQDFSFVPLPRYKCSLKYNRFLSHTWLYSKVNVCAAKKK